MREVGEGGMPAADGVRSFGGALRRVGSDGTLVALLIVALLIVILVPLPKFLLDLLIAANFVLALLLLVTSLINRQPSRLSSFPTVLLLATLLRLAVNVSSTRLILLYGDQGLGVAGNVIRTFGEMVVRGNFVVGAMIFGIIALVNFLVVAKGSARVAEVAARFVLDAVPGRQMAIDADLRMGRITPDEAAYKRAELSRESQFFGAMDGAMKFVQGDAIAGFVIVAVNAIGGLALGISRGLSWQDSVATFGVLAIGDGLVNCLPSLLTSLAAGFIVTHVHDQRAQSSGGQIFNQFLEDRHVLAFTAGTFLLLSVLGLPFVPFALTGAVLLFLAWYSRKYLDEERAGADWQVLDPLREVRPELPNAYQGLPQPRAGELPAPAIESQQLLSGGTAVSPFDVQPLELELDEGSFAGRWDSQQLRVPDEKIFRDFLDAQRHAFSKEYGMYVPEVSVRFASDLPIGGYRIRIREHVVRQGSVRLGEIFLGAPPSMLAIFGALGAVSVRHPVDYGLASWLPPDRNLFQAMSKLGVVILEPVEFLALDVLAATRDHLGELVGIDEVKREMKSAKAKFPGLYEEVVERGIISFPELTEVFRRLLRDQVSVRDIKTILEGIAEFAAVMPPDKDRGGWLLDLHDHLRKVCARSISAQALGPGGRIRTFLIASSVEDEFRSAVASWSLGKGKPPLEPEMDQQLREHSRQMFSPALERGALPVVVLCSGEIRAAVSEFLNHLFPSVGWFRTLSYEELNEQVRPLRPERPDVVGVLS